MMMNEKKARKPRTSRSTNLNTERQRIIAAERALVPLGSERVAVDTECYGLIAQLITQYKIRKHEVLRKALRVGLKALVQYDYKSPTTPSSMGTWHFEMNPGDEGNAETEEAPQAVDLAAMPQPTWKRNEHDGRVASTELDPEALAVAQG
jgi:hypothetical protein